MSNDLKTLANVAAVFNPVWRSRVLNLARASEETGQEDHFRYRLAQALLRLQRCLLEVHYLHTQLEDEPL
jgi:hypothetical protein